MKNKRNTGGFTLIELLVVVLIIGILSSIALPQYQKAVMKTRVLRLLPLLRAIDTAEQVYFLANGNYTTQFADLDIALPEGDSTSNATYLHYEDFACLLRTGDAENYAEYSAYCYSTAPMAPTIEKYFVRSTFTCWHEGNIFKKAICTGISGSKPRGDGSRSHEF